MDIFDILSLVGGIALFLFGMDIMSSALERRAGSSLKALIARLTTNKFTGLLTGLAVTAIIQSSAATTVMVVGFVNSGIMTLKQAISVIMGANIGTTVTAWILSLTGISGESFFIQLLKPSSFTPIVAIIGLILYMYCKGDKKKQTGLILLGFATLMFGMQTMTDSVSGLSEIPAVGEFLLLFRNPILGVLAGMLLTAAIQSSSASVGILQALTSTGHVTYGIAFPIIMGQNIGTCITAIISSFGTNKNAKRAAMCHLFFNVIGTVVWLSVFYIIRLAIHPAILDANANMTGIAIAHSIFNILCVCLMLPLFNLLEKMAYIIVPETEEPDTITKLDDRLLATPALALEQTREQMVKMCRYAIEALDGAMPLIIRYDEDTEENVKRLEKKTDNYEDILNNYLVKLSSSDISEEDSTVAAEYLKVIVDLERIADHAVNLCGEGQEIHDKNIHLSDAAHKELKLMFEAITEVGELTKKAFIERDMDACMSIGPLVRSIDTLQGNIKDRHVERMQRGECSAESSFVINDIMNDSNRIAGHCRNIAIYIFEASNDQLTRHGMGSVTNSEEFRNRYLAYRKKYSVEAG